MNKYRVLVVDDESDMRRLLECIWITLDMSGEKLKTEKRLLKTRNGSL